MSLPAIIAAPPPALPPIFARPPEGTAGTLSFVKITDEKTGEIRNRWKIEGTPGVVMMANGLFSGAISRKADSVSFPAFASIFEDLLMLQHRFPLKIAADARPVWEEFYRRSITRYRAIELRDDSVLPKRNGDARFMGELLPFQAEGERFLVAGRRTLLADEMGLGKTPQALAALDRLGEWPVVVVCQPHVVKHWERKTEEFLLSAPAGLPLAAGGKLGWHTLSGTKGGRLPEADIYIVHYLVLHAWWSALVERGVRVVVFDEVQELRHSGTKKYESAFAMAHTAPYVFGLSGTPIYNRGPEIFEVFQAISPGALGTKADFTRNWCEYSSEDGKLIVEDPQMLGQYLQDRHLMLRRRKDQVQSQLPPKRRAIEPISADNGKFAELVKEAVALAKHAETLNNPFDRARMEAEAITQTRRATGIAKIPAVVAFLTGLMEVEEPTLCFAHHHAVHDAIREGLAAHRPAFITGHQTMALKDSEQKRFQSGDTNLCVIALRAATGIDGLQARARVVVHAELDWSPAVHAQAEGRAHRMGQKNSVIVYFLVTDLGTDPWIMQTLNVKESQFIGLMNDPTFTDEDRALNEAATKKHTEEVLDMLRRMA